MYDFNKNSYLFILYENLFVEHVHKKAHLDIYYHYRSFNNENIVYICLPVQVQSMASQLEDLISKSYVLSSVNWDQAYKSVQERRRSSSSWSLAVPNLQQPITLLTENVCDMYWKIRRHVLKTL